VLLGFAEVQQGDATLTEIGRVFVDADVEGEKHIFRDQALEHAPMVRTMYEALVAAHGKPLRADFFLDILDETYSAEEAKAQFETAVNWGRFAGLLEYDSNDEELRLARDEAA